MVNHLEDIACPVKVWLGKLTALNITSLFVKAFHEKLIWISVCIFILTN